MATYKEYKKKDGSTKWLYKAYLGKDPITGKEIRTTRRNFDTRKEAILDYARLQLEVESNGISNRNTVKTYQDLYELWMSQHKENIRNTTEQRIRNYFKNQILPYFGKMNLNKITPTICQKILVEWAKKYKAFQKVKSYTSQVFKYGVLIGVIKDNPMERTITPKSKTKSSKSIDEVYSKEELQQFFNCLEELKDERAIAFFRLASYTGARKGEILGLTWKDIDFEAKTISFNKTLIELSDGSLHLNPTKTDKSNRVITIDDDTMVILKKWKRSVIKKNLSRGIRIDNMDDVPVISTIKANKKREFLYKGYPNHVMDKVAKKFPDMKIIKVHGFRKTHASLLFEAGAQIKDVQDRLGHSSSKTTMDIYIQVSKNRQEETVEMFSSFMNG
ncbi:site-specific integrase [Enterococcus sp. BWT-B8]|uniref:site-specific integrase n=1 Tax=Enterococcus sp. BWT-B8 TaxID=2885157 RepID=UPI001E45243E|nr:site-specific integrase [Enterococcus sp. BWT-B8]MCB5951265.1 site-specific integrase [Enterococcus sp. BWT-B8]